MGEPDGVSKSTEMENHAPDATTAGVERTAALRDHCLWILRGRGGETPTALPPADAERAEDWLIRLNGLLAAARHAAGEGERRDGLMYDGFKKQALALADELTLSEADRMLLVARVDKPFDRTAHGLAPWQWFAYPPMDAAERALLIQYQIKAGWEGESPETLESLRQTFADQYPEDYDLLAQAEENGRLFQILKRRAYQLGWRSGGKGTFKRLLDEASVPEKVQRTLWKVFCQAVALKRAKAAERAEPAAVSAEETGDSETAAAKDAETALSEAWAEKDGGGAGGLLGDGIHPNSILNLRPSQKWTVYGDESGPQFRDAGGRYVFVLVPEGVQLPPLPIGWHAVEQSLEENLSAARDLRRSGCGVLGIPVSALRPSDRDLWFPCIQELLELALGLLPLDGETEVELVVEQRGTANAENAALLGQTIDIATWRLAQMAPDRAKAIHVTGHFAGKEDNRWGGYADVAAYSWGCEPEKRRVFDEFGWVGPCLVAEDEETAAAFRRCFEMLQWGGRLPPADWSALASCREATAVGSLVGALLQECGKEARKDPGLWRTFLDHTVGHLDSNAIRMDLLQRQIAWLKEWEPDTEQIPPRLRLLWLTAQLAESNHLGGTKFGQEAHKREFGDLSRRLKDEDAPLCCCAALHLAVELTDDFRFEEAREVLRPWAEEPVAVPGLRCHAQVLSSLGQHEAFLGRNGEALALFERALAAFRGLSEGAEGECGQTLAYAVAAAMDARSPKLEGLLEAYFHAGNAGGEIWEETARRFARDAGAEGKFAHAIFLRWLAELPEGHPVRRAYAERPGEWRWGEDQHPWELIAFYRALLLGEGSEAGREWLRRGHDLAWRGGPTLKAIALVLGAGLMADAEMPAAAYLAEVEEVARLLPGLGAERMGVLREQAARPVGLLELAKRVLPFNFR